LAIQVMLSAADDSIVVDSSKSRQRNAYHTIPETATDSPTGWSHECVEYLHAS
jgi:hypothetical protein